MPAFARIASLLIAIPLGLQVNALAQDPFGLIARRPFLLRERDREPEEDEIETDRDSFTPATSVVGQGRLVIESAYSFIDNRSVAETHSLPELVTRYGISRNVELRFGYNYEVGGAGNPVSGNVPDELEEGAELERGSRVLYGTKVWLTEQDNWMPQSSVILQGFTPTSGKNTATNVSVAYIFGWELENDWLWDSGLRYGTSSFEEDQFNTWSPSTVVKVPIGEKWKAHVEYFATATQGREKAVSEHFFSSGAHYLITPNLEIGLRVGWGLNEQAPNFFSNVGGGIRF
jgi:hypothetical protein